MASFNNAKVKLSGTSITDVYQCSTSTGATAVVLSILVANVDGSSSGDITLTLANSGDTELSQIAHTIPVPADSTLEAIPNKLVLKSGEKIRATASAGNVLDVTLSVMEV